MKNSFLFFGLTIIFILTTFFLNVLAFESTSTNFEIHAGDLESVVGGGTSTNFSNTNAAGQNAHGFSTSTNRRGYIGILYWLFGRFTTDYNQIHYRWRNDDGSETSATWAATEDTSYSNLPQNTIKRLRIEVANKGWTRGSGIQLKLQYAQATTCSSGSYIDVPTTTALHWQIADSSNLTDGASTTNVSPGLTDENAFFTAGQVKDTSNLTSAINITSENFTEIEYSLKATNNSISGVNYCFRLVKGDGSLLDTYNVYPQITVTSTVATVSCSTNVTSTSFGNITTGSVFTSSPNVSSTLSCSGTAGGCSLYVQDAGNSSNPGLYKSTTPTYLILSADATLTGSADGYGIQAATTTAGSGGILSLNSKYNVSGNTVGGLTLSNTILASSTSDVTNREVIITHQASVSATSPSGNYSDTITYSCIIN
jgi:hypothetical protein